MLFNKLIPELSVKNLDRSLKFYCDVLGFNLEYARPENKFAFISLDDVQIMLEEDNGRWFTGDLEYPRGRGVNFQMEVECLDRIVASLKDSGMSLFRAMQEHWRKVDDIEYGEREILVQDPDGYLLRFSMSLCSRKFDFESQLKKWLWADPFRRDALTAAAKLALPDWYIAAGFVRNLVWDKCHGFEVATPLSDIDLVYFDATTTDESRDTMLEAQLKDFFPYNWSVKNQARMHLRNGDMPYRSSVDAMSFWPEEETAIGVRLTNSGELELVAPFGVEMLWNYSITLNRKRPKPLDFKKRVDEKKWLTTWPKLKPITK